MDNVSAFPLTWPESFPRAKHREAGKFKTAISAALNNVKGSLELFAKDSRKPLAGLVISSNVTLGAEWPQDPGVAVWFSWDGLQVCIPVDRYATVAANLQAVYHVIEARRVELRHGTLALVRATFTGFRALPAPDWRRILEVGETADLAVAEAQFKRKAKMTHPDQGGSSDAMAALNAALAAARKELRP